MTVLSCLAESFISLLFPLALVLVFYKHTLNLLIGNTVGGSFGRSHTFPAVPGVTLWVRVVLSHVS